MLNISLHKKVRGHSISHPLSFLSLFCFFFAYICTGVHVWLFVLGHNSMHVCEGQSWHQVFPLLVYLFIAIESLASLASLTHPFVLVTSCYCLPSCRWTTKLIWPLGGCWGCWFQFSCLSRKRFASSLNSISTSVEAQDCWNQLKPSRVAWL